MCTIAAISCVFFINDIRNTGSRETEFQPDMESSIVLNTAFPQPKTEATFSSTQLSGSNRTSCEPKRHIYYLKVHKTGSTTLCNILHRYGWRNRLSFPPFKIVHPPPNKDLTQYLSRADNGIKYDIMNAHSVWSDDNVYKLMPKDTVFIATLRHPFSQLKSTFNHYNLAKHFKMKNGSVESFLQNPAKYDKRHKVYSHLRFGNEYIDISYTKNRMAFEFGFDLDKAQRNRTYVKQYLAYLDRTFDDVLITESYDMSLVMMRRKLCWSFKDIIYMSLRSHNYDYKSKEPSDYGVLYENHKKWSELDYSLYDYFLAKHNAAITEPIIRETEYFQKILAKTSLFCNSICKRIYSDKTLKQLEEIKKEQIEVSESTYHPDFIITGEDCLGYMIHERYFHLHNRMSISSDIKPKWSTFYMNLDANDLFKEKTLMLDCHN